MVGANLIPLAEVMKITGLRKIDVYTLFNKGEFPFPQNIDKRTHAWDVDLVKKWKKKKERTERREAQQMETPLKKCNVCGKEKLPHDFYERSNCCKACSCKINKEYREQNKQKVKELGQKHMLKMLEKQRNRRLGITPINENEVFNMKNNERITVQMSREILEKILEIHERYKNDGLEVSISAVALQLIKKGLAKETT